MKAEVALKALQKIRKFIPLDLIKEVEKVENYLHQQMFIDEEMKNFTEGFKYKPEKELNTKMREWAKKIELAYSDDVDG